MNTAKQFFQHPCGARQSFKSLAKVWMPSGHFFECKSVLRKTYKTAEHNSSLVFCLLKMNLDGRLVELILPCLRQDLTLFIISSHTPQSSDPFLLPSPSLPGESSMTP